MEKTLFLQLFCVAKHTTKKVRWTFFSYASKEPKLVLQ